MVSWLGVLLGFLVLLVAVGGFVRLSGSGLSIPEWPFINGSLLPPFSDADWVTVKQEFLRDHQRLKSMQEAGAIGLGHIGRFPTDMADFKVMFYIEWSHRALASFIGFIAVACLVISLRKKVLWNRGGQLLATVVILLIGQATLGGFLVKSGTSTHFLFLHLGMAAIIFSLVIWLLLSFLCPSKPVKVDSETRSKRNLSQRLLVLAMVVTWLQIVFGALVAGSRAGAAVISDWPLMNGQLVPDLWNASQGFWWNALDNSVMLQWVHRSFAWFVVAMILLTFIAVVRSPAGERQRMAVHLVLGLLLTQMALGVMNVFEGGMNTILALAHLVTGFLLLGSQVVVLFDMRHEQPAEFVPRAYDLPVGKTA